MPYNNCPSSYSFLKYARFYERMSTLWKSSNHKVVGPRQFTRSAPSTASRPAFCLIETAKDFTFIAVAFVCVAFRRVESFARIKWVKVWAWITLAFRVHYESTIIICVTFGVLYGSTITRVLNVIFWWSNIGQTTCPHSISFCLSVGIVTKGVRATSSNGLIGVCVDLTCSFRTPNLKCEYW